MLFERGSVGNILDCHDSGGGFHLVRTGLLSERADPPPPLPPLPPLPKKDKEKEDEEIILFT